MMQNSDLQQSQEPQLPDLHTAEGRARHQHTNLIKRLVPEKCTHTHTQSDATLNSVSPSWRRLCKAN